MNVDLATCCVASERSTLRAPEAERRGLVLSGGGVKGAYQVGALRKWILEENNAYDVLTGISVGALNTSLLSMFPVSHEHQAYRALLNVWEEVDDRRIYNHWFPFRQLSSLWKDSVYNSRPLQELVRSKLNQESLIASGKQLRVGAVGLRSGKYKLFGQRDPDIVDAVIASSAFPAFLTPPRYDGEIWTDGGVKTIAPVKAALDLGANSVDIIVCAPEDNPSDMEDPNALDVAFRTIDLMSDAIIDKDLATLLKYNQFAQLAPEAASQLGIKYIPCRILRPSKVLIKNSLDFSPSGIQRMMVQGYEDACRLEAAQLTP